MTHEHDDWRDGRCSECERLLLRRHFVYADPPYVGCAALYDHPDAARWDEPETHVELLRLLDADEAIDGWAVSASAPSLRLLLPAAPEGTRVAAWVKPFAAYKRNIRVAYTWEPVLFRVKRDRRPGDPVTRDHLAASIARMRGLPGAKPERFAEWVRLLLGAQPGDDVEDLFPGTGTCGEVFDRLRLL